MDVNFEHTDAAAVQPIVFEKVWGEKPGGGLVANPAFDLPLGIALGKNSDGDLTAIKAYRLVKAVAVADATIEIAKGSGVVVDDYIAHGTLAVKCTAVDKTTNADKDVVTVTMGVEIANDTVLFQSTGASVPAVAEIKAGYYDALVDTPNALLIVAAAPGAGEVLLADVQASYQGNEIIVAGQYVTLEALTPAVVGVNAAPIYTPLWLAGESIESGKGDKLIRLVNGATVRKETVPASTEVVALLKNVELV